MKRFIPFLARGFRPGGLCPSVKGTACAYAQPAPYVSYSAAILMFVGIGLALQSWLSLGILFFAHCHLYGRRVAVEERALLGTLGNAYSEYMQHTKRFIPFIIQQGAP